MSNRKKAVRLFIDEEKTLSEISKKLGISMQRVRDILISEEIPLKKKCTVCGKKRYLRKFAKDSRRPFKRASQCKDCKKLRNVSRRQILSIIKDGKKYCKHCKDWYDVEGGHFYLKRKGVGHSCKIKQKERSLEQIRKNPERHGKYVKNWTKKKEKELGITYQKFRSLNLVDSYIAETLRHRKNSTRKFYRDDYEKERELFEKAREKIRLEREIREDVTR